MAEPARPLPEGILPLGLPRLAAAAYCGMTPGEFDAAVDRGELPKALPLRCRRKLWHTEALRKALDGMAGIEASSPESKALDRVKGWLSSKCGT